MENLGAGELVRTNDDGGQSLELIPPAPVRFWTMTFTPGSTDIVFGRKDREAFAGALFQISALGGAEKKLVAGILAILLGSLAIHKFYLGYTKEAVIHLVISLVTCGSVGSILGIIEGIIYLTKSDEEFVETYVKNEKAWF